MPTEARIFVAALAFRVLSSFLAYAANLFLPQFQDQGFGMFPGRDHPFWDAFLRFDAGWYHGIASQGYEYRGEGRNNLAFFPAYPLLMRAGGWLLGGRQPDFYFAGIVVSWLAFAAAMVLLYRVARFDLSPSAALRTVVYAGLFPFAYFFGMVYSESLYLLALLAAVLALRSRRWLVAGAGGALLTATRVTGIAAVPGLALVGWHAATTTRGRAAAIAATGASALGIIGYSAFNATISPSVFTWYESITFWNYHPGGNPFTTVLGVLRALFTRPLHYLSEERMAPYDALNTAAALLALALVPLIWKRFGLGYALIVLTAILLPLSSGQLEGLGRYVSVQFPVALALASSERRWLHFVLLPAFGLLYVACQSLFVTVHPLF